MATTQKPVVLVIEDDPPVRELLDDVLHDEGYEVVAVHDGSVALQVIESLKVDLITLDLDLPGLTGSDLLSILQKRKVAIPPVVVITAKSPVKRQIKQMAQAVITKPFDIDDLIKVVLDLLPRDLSRARQRLMQRSNGIDE